MMETEYSGVRLSCARLLSCLLTLLLFCSLGLAQAGSAQLTGSITYRERIALPPDAVIDVQLADVSVADLAAQTVADSLINAEGRQVPVPFTLAYDPTQIVPAHQYSVRATIRGGDGMMMFSTTQAYPVLTHGAPSKVNLVLHLVGHGGKHAASERKQPEPAASKGASSVSEAAPPQTGSTAASNEPASAEAVTPPTTEPSPSNTTAPSSAQATEQPPATRKAEQSAAPPTTPVQGQAPEAAASSATQAESQPAESEPTAPPAPTGESAPSGNAAPGAEAATQSSAAAAAEQATPTPLPTTEGQAPSAESASTSSTAAAESQSAQPQAPTPTEAQVAAPESAPPPAPTSATAPESAAPSQAENTSPSSETKTTESQQPLPEAPSATKAAELAAEAPESTEAEPPPESRPERSHPLAVTGSTPLANTQWRLVQLEGKQVVITPPQRPVTLAFSPEGTRIAGSAGCNSYLGTFHDSHGHLQLDPGGMTMMACADPAGSRESKFIAMLRSADGYKLGGNYLLLTSNGKTVAKFTNNPEQ